ncbi:TPA: hypothetical protein O8U57_001481 [Enterobacter asburiae]|uniref:hypothetical protein n=1 Tax=Enterobacter cloacae complex TaxID=354276 RepID=UPI0013275D31|nr:MULTISPECIES: hypothetical protein [Enterobacter cloacae complex]KAB2165402.1 hypothetical protein FZI34_10485 [Cronobacter sakazakii]MCK7049194.1 hypothetical protein [Enterobacter roggenkampii]MCK7263115.1 hypothetical protein [Enterobacter asburiae]HDC4767366.1 hypothetical protein [Enterobacter asburiae]
MNLSAMIYPDTFIIEGEIFKGKRNSQKKQVLIPYTNEPEVIIGQHIIQSVGKNEIKLKVLDMKMVQGGTLKRGTKHPHMLTLSIENMTENEHKSPTKSSTFHIGSINGEQVQVGESNHMLVNISITELVEKVAKSGDPQAKSVLKQLLENSTVASIVGAGTSALLNLL